MDLMNWCTSVTNFMARLAWFDCCLLLSFLSQYYQALKNRCRVLFGMTGDASSKPAVRQAVAQQQNCSLTSFHGYNIPKRRILFHFLSWSFYTEDVLQWRYRSIPIVYRGTAFPPQGWPGALKGHCIDSVSSLNTSVSSLHTSVTGHTALHLGPQKFTSSRAMSRKIGRNSHDSTLFIKYVVHHVFL